MASEQSSKINQLLKKWPPGCVAVLPWLERQGVYQQLVHEYIKTSWLRRVGQGAYAREGDKIDWTGGLYAMQEQIGLPIHVGGKTALQMLGYAHFLPLGKGQTVWLFGTPNVKLPAWFKEYPWEVTIRYTTNNLFSAAASQGLTRKEVGAYSVAMASPERAIMEVLSLAPKQESYEEAKLLMEGLTTLRPRLVQTLLEDCNSIKVKRLFMVLAESSQLRWVTKLELSRVDFGKGKRMLVRGGRFDSKYNITVPDTGT